jgi:hypothetical protein
MRGLVAALGAVWACGMIAAAAPAEAKETDEFTIGQWAGFSYSNNDTSQFTDCEIWAWNRDNVQLGVSVLKDWSLELWLNSKAWDLPANQSYPITYWVDRNQQYSGRAATYSGKFVIIKVEQDQNVYDELKAGGQVTFRAQNQDYVFNLNGSSAALSRLLDCVDRYSKTASANPFGGDSGVTSDTQQQSSTQQSGGFEGASQSGGASSTTSMSTFTVTADQVRQFLVEVTGAKPSMITVSAKTDSNDVAYYDLKTPLGNGQFWQEKLGGRNLADVAESYVNGYKKDCEGDFDPALKDPAQGEHGTLATGVAACSKSKYQDDGPEFMSYSFIEADGVVSFYMTFVGGNAAKAKSDGLGKLIAKRSEETIR